MRDAIFGTAFGSGDPARDRPVSMTLPRQAENGNIRPAVIVHVSQLVSCQRGKSPGRVPRDHHRAPRTEIPNDAER